MCTQLGAHIVYPIGYIKCVPDWVPSLDLLSAEPMPYKARLGARFVYPIGYSVYVPDRVHISVYLPYSEGLLEFCSQADQIDIKGEDLVTKIEAKEAPESWSWVEQVSDGDDEYIDDDIDHRVELPPSKTRDNVEAAPTLPPSPPLTPVCGRY